ncbi:hypothetical protein E4T38_01882 [Aureobasidium subglaciale]|nr:hypothetical protein E4T38_01882 [Aureobasidium subglaciale]KAI5229316.1 hypothetical protein E4T40_01598 [Aureobasidium subglaciale]KAI5233009.1 hypothetical protein E4T41_01880 [Aureobasidium subglaciale]KAI5266400.1 hypothetical protein E4T46_01595 [Aureobasidium subglaciale]
MEEICYIYMNTSTRSNLRKFSEHHATYCDFFDLPVAEVERLPVKFLVGVVMTSGKKLEKELEAKKKADSETTAIVNPPFENDICLYHEHTTKKEMKACRARRGTSQQVKTGTTVMVGD